RVARPNAEEQLGGAAPDLADDRDDRRCLPLREGPAEDAKRSLRVLARLPQISEPEVCVREGALDDADPESRRIRVDGLAPIQAEPRRPPPGTATRERILLYQVE